MQMCGDCGKVYDESEYSKCPYCHGFGYESDEEPMVIVYDRDKKEAITVPKSEAYKYNY